MVRQNPALSFWDRLLTPFRARDWEGCLQQLKPVLDADEDALIPRLFCAGLHLAAGQSVLALLQYETLLPLAVGQGEFFAAIAAQKRLDLLHPASVTHARRYEVLRRWFLSLGHGLELEPGQEPGELHESALLGLDPEAFTQVMEECRIEGLEPDPRTVVDSDPTVRVVLYGRAVWTLRRGGEIALLEGIAEAGQSLAVNPAAETDETLLVSSELPTEMLVFGSVALAAIRAATASDDSNADDGSATETTAIEPAAPASGPPSPETRPARRSSAPVERPRPDPRFEPFVATFAPAERRRESRVAISLTSGVARLGLADTRVAPVGGRLTRLTADTFDLVFPRRDLRHLRTRLEGSCLGLQFNFGPEEPALRCTGRVRWTTALAAEASAQDMKIEIEFLALLGRDRDRLLEVADRFPDPAQPGKPNAA